VARAAARRSFIAQQMALTTLGQAEERIETKRQGDKKAEGTKISALKRSETKTKEELIHAKFQT
jgi:hypothetical protein